MSRPASAQPAEAPTPMPVARRYPPMPLVGVAVAVFRPGPRCGEVLMVRRKRPPRAGEWGLPGGLLNLGETLTTGAARELWEECRVTAQIGGLVDVFEPIHYDDAGRVEYHYVVIEYWATYRTGQAQAHDDAAEVGWLLVDELSTYHVQPDSQRVIQKAHRAWQDWMEYGSAERL